MARPRGYKRLTRKARHLIRHLRRTRHASVQDQMIHELRHEVSRTHGFHGPKKAPERSSAGHWRPLTRRAKQMLTRLRKAKVWSVQKQIVNELAREIERGRRMADRARERARGAAKRVRAGYERSGRASRAAGRGARKAWNTARPRVSKAQERMLARAERRQGEREAGKRKPALTARARRAVRDRAGRIRGSAGSRLRSLRRTRVPGRKPGPVPSRPVRALPRPAPVRPRAPRVRAARSPRPARARVR